MAAGSPTLSAAPNGKVFASRLNEDPVRLWDVTNGQEDSRDQKTPALSARLVRGRARFSPAPAKSKSGCGRWRRGKQTRPSEGSSGTPRPLAAFSADGKQFRLDRQGQDNPRRPWSGQAKKIGTFKAKTAFVGVRFRPAKTLVSLCPDGTPPFFGDVSWLGQMRQAVIRRHLNPPLVVARSPEPCPLFPPTEGLHGLRETSLRTTAEVSAGLAGDLRSDSVARFRRPCHKQGHNKALKAADSPRYTTDHYPPSLFVRLNPVARNRGRTTIAVALNRVWRNENRLVVCLPSFGWQSETREEHAQENPPQKRWHEQQEWLRVTLSSIGDAVITTDTQGCVTFLNIPWPQSLTGWDGSDEASGVPLESVVQDRQ